ncbi:DNA adenine methylase [Mucilaginibacter sp. X4EP1]|uniref:DNA adenine methylase n=1 Tax=Mucilaginibacter sp. X4EP1 TaxID=2723092 RepID=UPI00216A4F66|nr:DNA adenine methylase [Mucilaginibacter sp. X4EP1]MCS3815468.1 DNA adenine methylase [Mucilaginibacter sp. X4EP1]
MGNFKTPLRYPGGKQRLTPFVNEILDINKIDGHYVEPFAGGAGVGIELLLSKKVNHIHLNDSFIGIYAFWYAILNHTEEFCRLISTASMTVDEWKLRKEIVKRADTTDLLELGFSLFYLNRCNRSGVLSAGIIGGLDQTGNYKMDARFSRNDLIRRIETIGIFRDQVTITNMDAEQYIYNYIPNLPLNSLVYLDPPYYNKGSDLYLNSYLKGDHSRLANVIQNEIQHRWILSYDGVSEIINLYDERRHFLYDLQYTAAKVYKGKEVFVFCDDIILPNNSILKHVDLGLSNLVNG